MPEMPDLKNKSAEFLAHSYLWEREAVAIIDILKNIFTEYAVDIQHIGSTAIKKIKAKPIIDIVVGLTDIKNIYLFEDKLKLNGFIYDLKSNEKRQLFFKINKANNKTHNIYIVNHNGKSWYDYIIFRDYMNINENKAREYEALQLSVKGKYKYAIPTYIKVKSDFIKKTIENNFYSMMLGKTINITNLTAPAVLKTENKNYIYPVTHGIAHNAKTQDVYVLGNVDNIVDNIENIETITGKVIAYFLCKDDKGNIINRKWIAAKNDAIIYKPEIYDAIEFYDSDYIKNQNIELVCMYEKSCGAVIYTEDGDSIKFLLVKSSASERIGFPKGHIEKGETEIDTAIREVYEETSLNVVINSDFKEEYDYTINGYINKKVVYFLAEFNMQNTYKIRDSEIVEQLLLSFEESYRMLRFNQDKDILKRAYEKITKITEKIEKAEKNN